MTNNFMKIKEKNGNLITLKVKKACAIINLSCICFELGDIGVLEFASSLDEAIYLLTEIKEEVLNKEKKN